MYGIIYTCTLFMREMIQYYEGSFPRNVYVFMSRISVYICDMSFIKLLVICKVFFFKKYMFRFQYSSGGFFVFSSLGEGLFNIARPLRTTGILFLRRPGVTRGTRVSVTCFVG